ncbi:MT-A70-domain-containing protein [Amylocarpus encephaloides]|uniref:MT-A70-domain-containing protein n=1 Tax=Amylocarpus encephaloides TaxID=45428 RepID=A0A9P7YAL5_9HELO|nr:MT-A70-domain-containing protein [Amylocarpus encephaloides]
MGSCILHRDKSIYVTILEIPRSIELAQGESTRRIVSSPPLEKPFPSLEPKSSKAKESVPKTSIEDLLLQKHLEFALQGIKSEYKGKWCLPRITEPHQALDKDCDGRRKITQTISMSESSGKVAELDSMETEQPYLYQNLDSSAKTITINTSNKHIRLPPNSTALLGSITSSLPTFKSQAPKFDLIIMDPPWPNRSARRKKSYGISYCHAEIKTLLSFIPAEDHLTGSGFVAVWVTNKPAFREMVIGEGGLFEQWGVEFVEEWVWLKVTVDAEPICELDSVWRKPYEILLVGRRGGVAETTVKRRVIVAVPDLHSRKPNLKVLFQELMGEEEYLGLEVFARNLTAGWWAWGNEVLKFQGEDTRKTIKYTLGYPKFHGFC